MTDKFKRLFQFAVKQYLGQRFQISLAEAVREVNRQCKLGLTETSLQELTVPPVTQLSPSSFLGALGPKHWTPTGLAKDKGGNEVDPKSDAAVKWSLSGVLARFDVTRRKAIVGWLATRGFRGVSLAAFNEHAGHESVLNCLRECGL